MIRRAGGREERVLAPAPPINRLLRVMLHTHWSAEAWSQVRSSSGVRSRCGMRFGERGGSSILELISLDRFVTYVQVSPRPGPHHMRSGRRVGSFSARIASRAFSRRIVSSGVTVPQGWPIWCAPDALRPDAGLRHPGEPDGRQAETTPELARETGPETGVGRCSDEDASPG
jgi:hypothetical protein